MISHAAGLVVIFSAVLTLSVEAAPFRPNDDRYIVEHINRSAFASSAQIRDRRAVLARQPQNLALATQAARDYVLQARAAGDPRFLGYAQAALNPWWNDASAPPEVIVLRAIIRQSGHQFDAALKDLDTLIQRDPRDLQARLTRASIFQVQARYADARRDCASLLLSGQSTIGLYCLATIAHLAGQTQRYYDLLAANILQNQVPEQMRAAAFTVLGEMAARLNQPAQAEKHFRSALSAGSDAYLESAFADFLLDQRRPFEVLKLLGPGPFADGALLRRALAQQMLGDAGLAVSKAELQARYAASKARGDNIHQREFARFALYLENNPGAALQLAQSNWRVQREPADARVLLEAALAANKPGSVREVAAWLLASHNDDPFLRQLAQRVLAAKA